MRIAILTELYYPSLGGQELFFEGLGEALLRRGHSVEVFCIAHEAGLAAEETRGGIVIRRHPSAPHYKTPRRAWMKRDWPAILRYALWTRREALAGGYDFHILNQWPLLHVPALPRRERRRALAHWCEVRTGGFYRAVQSRLPRLTRLNGAISDSVGAAISAASGRPVITLPSGIRRADYRNLPRSERSGMMTLGRVVEHKNLPLLIEAWETLRRGGYAGRLTLAGDGPDLARVKERAAASPFAAAIDFPGRIDDPTKIALLAASEVFAMPSRREGFPRVVAEAMASGLPVVTADYPENGTKDVVRDYGCGVVTAPDAASLAEGLKAALADFDRYAEAGLRRSEALDWDTIAAFLEEEMRRALA